jgi:pimeloyl-ACP methyl ester carboxylesterase
MRTVVLVHGAWHGPWCWAQVLAGLDELGVASLAVDCGGPTLAADAESVRAALDDLGAGTGVVLAGHSYGGAVITAAGTHRSVERLVYLCAFAPDADETVVGVARDHADPGDLGPAVEFGDDGTSTLDPKLVPDLLYGDCSAVDVARAIALLRPQHGATLTTPPRVAAWRTTPTTYVVCGADRAVPPSLQRRMAERIPDVALVEWPDASHSPFLSRPGDVTALLAGLAGVAGLADEGAPA